MACPFPFLVWGAAPAWGKSCDWPPGLRFGFCGPFRYIIKTLRNQRVSRHFGDYFLDFSLQHCHSHQVVLVANQGSLLRLMLRSPRAFKALERVVFPPFFGEGGLWLPLCFWCTAKNNAFVGKKVLHPWFYRRITRPR